MPATLVTSTVHKRARRRSVPGRLGEHTISTNINISRIRTARALVAIGALSLGLGAASPASGADNNTTPVDKDGKKACLVSTSPDGTKQWSPHGTKIITQWKDGYTRTEECKDGTWSITIEPSTGTSGTTWTYPSGGSYGTTSSGSTPTHGGTSGTNSP